VGGGAAGRGVSGVGAAVPPGCLAVSGRGAGTLVRDPRRASPGSAAGGCFGRGVGAWSSVALPALSAVAPAPCSLRASGATGGLAGVSAAALVSAAGFRSVSAVFGAAFVPGSAAFPPAGAVGAGLAAAGFTGPAGGGVAAAGFGAAAGGGVGTACFAGAGAGESVWNQMELSCLAGGFAGLGAAGRSGAAPAARACWPAVLPGGAAPERPRACAGPAGLPAASRWPGAVPSGPPWAPGPWLCCPAWAAAALASRGGCAFGLGARGAPWPPGAAGLEAGAPGGVLAAPDGAAPAGPPAAGDPAPRVAPAPPGGGGVGGRDSCLVWSRGGWPRPASAAGGLAAAGLVAGGLAAGGVPAGGLVPGVAAAGGLPGGGVAGGGVAGGGVAGGGVAAGGLPGGALAVGGFAGGGRSEGGSPGRGAGGRPAGTPVPACLSGGPGLTAGISTVSNSTCFGLGGG